MGINFSAGISSKVALFENPPLLMQAKPELTGALKLGEPEFANSHKLLDILKTVQSASWFFCKNEAFSNLQGNEFRGMLYRPILSHHKLSNVKLSEQVKNVQIDRRESTQPTSSVKDRIAFFENQKNGNAGEKRATDNSSISDNSVAPPPLPPLSSLTAARAQEWIRQNMFGEGMSVGQERIVPLPSIPLNESTKVLAHTNAELELIDQNRKASVSSDSGCESDGASEDDHNLPTSTKAQTYYNLGSDVACESEDPWAAWDTADLAHGAQTIQGESDPVLQSIDLAHGAQTIQGESDPVLQSISELRAEVICALRAEVDAPEVDAL